MEEIKPLLSQAPDQRARTLVLAGLYLGTRISESLALNFGDFADGEFVTIRSLKGSRTRTLSLNPHLRSEIHELRKDYEGQGITVTEQTPLFLSQKMADDGGQKAISRQHAAFTIQKMKQAAGLAGRVTGHSFRKNFVTELYRLLDHNLVELAQYTGHRSLDALRAYIATTGRTDQTKQLDWPV
jgi:integrase